MIDSQENQDLNAWPSECFEKEKFNVVEFYHKILWASQQQQQQQQKYQHCEDHNKNNRKRVTFSVKPPQVYEYEPEYSTTTRTTTSFFSDYFKRKFHHLEQEQHPSRKSQTPINQDYFKEKTIVRVRSLTDFNPVPNQLYKQQLSYQSPPYHESMQPFDSSFMHIDMSFGIEHQEDMYAALSPASTIDDSTTILSPPPSYNEDCMIIERKKSLAGGLKRRISMNFWSLDSENASRSSSSSSSNTTENTGFMRTLRKIRSSPRLMIQRRASVVSLHKKASFLGA